MGQLLHLLQLLLLNVMNKSYHDFRIRVNAKPAEIWATYTK